jgi:penicillin-binding protein 1A
MAERKPSSKNKKPKKTGLGKWVWILGLLALACPALLMFLVSIGVFGALPDTRRLENPQTAIATEIITEDGQIIGKYFNENRSPVNFDQLSPNLVDALVSTEDVRFYEHAGIDFQRSFTIFLHLLAGERQGASTISQQLAKNLFPRKHYTTPELIIRKLKEWLLAVRLERLYTKNEIIAMYFNTVEFGGKSIAGIQSASETFFGKSPAELNVDEAAILVGIQKSPAAYNPQRHPARSMARRNTVLNQMRKYGKLTDEQYAKFSKMPMDIHYQLESHNEGMATYFREYLRTEFLDKWCDEHGYDLYSDGLKIYTTLDSRMQKYAESAVREHMQDLQKEFYAQFRRSGTKPWSGTPEIIDLTMKRSERYRALREDSATDEEIKRSFSKPVRMKVFSYRGAVDTVMSPLDSIKYYKYFLQPGFMVMDPKSGHVKAWVGGLDFHFFKYDHVAPNAKRQVGSTFKPFVYATAIVAGFSPCQKLPNTPVVFEDYQNWSPRNDDDKYGGEMTLKKGLAQSVNCIAARVMKEVGIKPVVDMAHQMGIVSNLDPVPSLCLGVSDLSVYEMAGAYNTFNNYGEYVQPQVIMRIEDKNGNILQDFVPHTRVVMDDKKDYIMLNMLQGVTDCHLGGTGCRLRYKFNLRGPMGGKTGTSQNHSDGWFVGIIPQLTGAVWVGAEDRAVHFNSMTLGQGAAEALPIWAKFLQKVYADKDLNIDPDANWIRPEGDLGVEMDCSQYDLDDSNPSDILGG